MAQIDGQIDLVVLGDIVNVLLVLHVHCHELVTDFRRMFCVVHQAELLRLDVQLKLRVVFQTDALAFDLLAPAVLVEAFPEEDHVGEHDLVVEGIDPIAHSVKVESENLVNQHLLAINHTQVVVVAFPFGGVG